MGQETRKILKRIIAVALIAVPFVLGFIGFADLYEDLGSRLYPMTVLPCDTLSKIWFMTLRVGTVLGQVMQIPTFSIFHFFNPNLACIFPVNVL